MNNHSSLQIHRVCEDEPLRWFGLHTAEMNSVNESFVLWFQRLMMSRTVTALDTQQVLRDRFSPAAFMTEERESLVHYHSICFGSLFICAISVVVVAASIWGCHGDRVTVTAAHLIYCITAVGQSACAGLWLTDASHLYIHRSQTHASTCREPISL